MLGNHEGHLEVLLDHHTWALTIYIYDADMNEVAIEGEPVVNFMTKSGPRQVVGEGEDSMWMFLDDAIDAEIISYRFRFRMGGKIYTPEWRHDHKHP